VQKPFSVNKDEYKKPKVNQFFRLDDYLYNNLARRQNDRQKNERQTDLIA